MPTDATATREGGIAIADAVLATAPSPHAATAAASTPRRLNLLVIVTSAFSHIQVSSSAWLHTASNGRSGAARERRRRMFPVTGARPPPGRSSAARGLRRVAAGGPTLGRFGEVAVCRRPQTIVGTWRLRHARDAP